MSLSRVHTWIAGEVLTASDLNSEFNNIINNAASLFSPLTGSLNLAGFTVTADAAGVTTFASSSRTAWVFSPGTKSGTPSSTGSVADWAAHTFTDTATAGAGTATLFTGLSIQRPTLAASNATVTTTDAASFYVANSPLAGTNETLTNSWALWTDDGGVRHDLTNSKASAAGATLRSFYMPAATQTVSGGTNITTAAGFNLIEIERPTISAGTALTVTNSATMYIANSPLGGGAGPATITNAYALWVDAGNVRFDDNILFMSGTAFTATLDHAITADRTYTFPDSSGTLVTAASLASINGGTRNAKMSVTSANASGTLTADEIVVSTTLGGTPQILASYSQACNLAATGAGGMDTGTAPISGFVSVYAIAKADGTKSILACAVATSTASIYGGANMPSGYTYSALLCVWPTDGSSRFKAGFMIDRYYYYQTAVQIFSGTTGPTSLTSQSISSGVPAAARYADVILAMRTTARSWVVGLSGDSTGSGMQVLGTTASSIVESTTGGLSASAAVFTARVPMITAQTVWWIEAFQATTDDMYISGYGV